jgi:hypothetical protein
MVVDDVDVLGVGPLDDGALVVVPERVAPDVEIGRVLVVSDANWTCG